MKQCGICLKDFPSLWKAKRKLPDGTIEPAKCKECATKPKVGDLLKPKGQGNFKPTHRIVSITPIPRQSDKEKKRQAAYKVVRKYYLDDHPKCEAMVSRDCNFIADQIHHKCGRIGDLLINMKYFLATCDSCHKWIEKNVKKAKILGFSLNRLDK